MGSTRQSRLRYSSMKDFLMSFADEVVIVTGGTSASGLLSRGNSRRRRPDSSSWVATVRSCTRRLPCSLAALRRASRGFGPRRSRRALCPYEGEESSPRPACRQCRRRRDTAAQCNHLKHFVRAFVGNVKGYTFSVQKASPFRLSGKRTYSTTISRITSGDELK